MPGMDDGGLGEGQSLPPGFTARRREVWRALKGRETEQYPLSEWYLGALCVLGDVRNPDRVSQAAQSLREVLEKLPEVVLGMDARVRSSGFQGMRRDLNCRLSKDKRRYSERVGW